MAESANPLSQVERELSLASRPNEVFIIGSRWWGTLAKSGNDAELIARLDGMLGERIAELQQLHGSFSPLPRVEKGQYLPPTPRIGEPVVWFQANNPKNQFAAIVVHIEQPGQVELRLLKPKNGHFGAPDNVLGVRHRSDPIHDGNVNQATVQNGSWDFLEHSKPGDFVYRPAREQLAIREKNTLEANEKQAARMRAINEQQELAKDQSPLTV